MTDLLRGLRVRLRALLHRADADRELDDEIRFHLEQETARHVAEGVEPAEARRRALLAFGNVQLARETHREVRGFRPVEELIGDVRFALRTLYRSPGLAFAAIATLALGVGAITAIFSAVNAVMLRPLPFAEPERLVMLWEESAERDWHRQTVAPANFLDWREEVPALEDAAAYADFSNRVTLLQDGTPRLLRSALVTGNFFSVLRASPALGRTLTDEETWGTAPVAVLSDRAWRTHFGGDAAIVGRSIDIDGRQLQVVGVIPPGFAFPWEDVDLWQPMEWNREDVSQPFFRRAHWLRVVGRLAPGATLAHANEQLATVAARLRETYPATNETLGAGMTPLREFLVGDTSRPLLILLAAVTLLLLIACANVGNLLLVQAANRAREVSLRLALGAGRMRLVRQAITESLVLSFLGGSAGLLLGWLGTSVLASMLPPGILRVSEFGIDWRVVGFVLVVVTASGLLFGMAPAMWSAGRFPGEALRDSARGSGSGRTRRWGNALVVGEVALALMLSVGAGLLVRSFVALQRVDPGFEPEGVIAVSLVLPSARYDTMPKVHAFYDELVARTKTLPGVTDAAIVRQIPLGGASWSSGFAVAGRPVTPATQAMDVLHRDVSPEYFRTMRVPILGGRPFSAADREDAPPVVIINRALARAAFPDGDPVGQRVSFDREPDSASTWFTIVGVVGDEHQVSPAEAPKMEIFAPARQEESRGMVLVARTAGEPAGAAPAIHRIIRELDPALAVRSTETLEDVAARSVALERFLMLLLVVFAIVGVTLAVVGVYGVLAQVVRNRTRELGIRIALGAARADVQWLVVRQGLALAGAGLAIGTAVALAATRAVRGILYGVPAADPLTFAVAMALLALTVLAAAWIPARRASRADPAVALRAE
jgi:putative ABC transport system permease protein